MEDRSITFVPKRFDGRRLQPVLSGKYLYAGIYYNMVGSRHYIIVDLFNDAYPTVKDASRQIIR
jgi:hypothetical protein